MANENSRRENITIARFGILLAGIIFIGIGIYRNETAIILRKAINICLECIGIG